jgi:hypothetical protein
LNESLSTPSTSNGKKGKRVVLPSSFVGGQRYMDALYFDGMAISAAVGFPDLFITFTCNPNWPEILNLLQKDNLKPTDRPDIVSRIFKAKFDEFLKDLTKRHVLGKVVACKSDTFYSYTFTITTNNNIYNPICILYKLIYYIKLGKHICHLLCLITYMSLLLPSA